MKFKTELTTGSLRKVMIFKWMKRKLSKKKGREMSMTNKMRNGVITDLKMRMICWRNK